MMLRRHGPLAILLLLGLQGALLLKSMDNGPASIFCTGGSGWLPRAYQALHLGFLFMAVMGVAALRWPRLRLPYAALLIVGLCVLVFQPMFVTTGQLTCNAP